MEEQDQESEGVLQSVLTGVVLVNAWKQYEWLRAGFSTRIGGESSVYGTKDLNLGWTVEDSPEVVRRNRVHFVQAVGGDPLLDLVTVRQFHSNIVCHVAGKQRPLSTPDGRAILRGDALMSDCTGLLLGVQTADCVPILVADLKQRVVAAFHAGWRGTLARIVERGIGDFQLRYGSVSNDIVAAIGPCIGACCFVVGPEVRSSFCSQFAYADQLFSKQGGISHNHANVSELSTRPASEAFGVVPQMHLDLVAANKRQLLAAGVLEQNITIVGDCTACTHIENEERKYFSYRADQGTTGRMLSVIGIAH